MCSVQSPRPPHHRLTGPHRCGHPLGGRGAVRPAGPRAQGEPHPGPHLQAALQHQRAVSVAVSRTGRGPQRLDNVPCVVYFGRDSHPQAHPAPSDPVANPPAPPSSQLLPVRLPRHVVRGAAALLPAQRRVRTGLEPPAHRAVPGRVDYRVRTGTDQPLAVRRHAYLAVRLYGNGRTARTLRNARCLSQRPTCGSAPG